MREDFTHRTFGSRHGVTEDTFECQCGEQVKADILAVNEPRTLKVIVPDGLEPQGNYHLKVVTQTSAKHSGTLLKEVREVRSEFTLTARK